MTRAPSFRVLVLIAHFLLRNPNETFVERPTIFLFTSNREAQSSGKSISGLLIRGNQEARPYSTCSIIMLVWVNSLVNPLLYAVRINEFKRAAKALFCKELSRYKSELFLFTLLNSNIFHWRYMENSIFRLGRRQMRSLVSGLGSQTLTKYNMS